MVKDLTADDDPEHLSLNGAVYGRLESPTECHNPHHSRLVLLTSQDLKWGDQDSDDFVAIDLGYSEGEGVEAWVKIFTTESRPCDKTAVAVKNVLGAVLGKQVWGAE
mmetsp:Transcript_22274/g.63575  ORF Transcript_22274/g.63575 Transcript_22274/m.63575 type:complete len:107 (+) Transcript_22274:232-552(+)